jgi:hypothetical protein
VRINPGPKVIKLFDNVIFCNSMVLPPIITVEKQLIIEILFYNICLENNSLLYVSNYKYNGNLPW